MLEQSHQKKKKIPSTVIHIEVSHWADLIGIGQVGICEPPFSEHNISNQDLEDIRCYETGIKQAGSTKLGKPFAKFYMIFDCLITYVYTELLLIKHTYNI